MRPAEVQAIAKVARRLGVSVLSERRGDGVDNYAVRLGDAENAPWLSQFGAAAGTLVFLAGADFAD